MIRRSKPALGPLLYISGVVLMGLYFTFAAVQGDYGVFRRAEVTAEARDLRAQLAAVQADVARMET